MVKNTAKFEMPRESALSILRVFASQITESEAEKWLADGPYAIQAEINESTSKEWVTYLSSVLAFAKAIGLSEEELIKLRFGHFLDLTGQIKADEKKGILWRDSSNATGNPLYTWDLTVQGKILTCSKSAGFGVTQESAIMPTSGAEAEKVIAVMKVLSEIRSAPVFFEWNGQMMRSGDGIIIAVNSANNPLAKYL